MDYWFRVQIEGWENIPDPPVLLVGVHSGAPFVWDAWTIGVQWWRRFGDERPLHGTAHDALTALPLVGGYFRRMGVLPAAPDSMTAALAAGHDVALWPGGERDSLRPWTKRDEAVLAGRTGSSGWRSGAAFRSFRSRPSGAQIRCPCWPPGGDWPRRCA